MAREAGVHRVTVCTNGIRLARDEAFVAALAAAGRAHRALVRHLRAGTPTSRCRARTSLETKLRCLDLLEKHDVDTTLIPVMTRGVNDHEIGDILELALARPNIRHVEVHTITFTGQGGASASTAPGASRSTRCWTASRRRRRAS